MAGFRNITEWVDAYEAGQTFYTVMRKGPQPSGNNDSIKWFDWTTQSGYPTANFYASAPLVAARLDNAIRLPTPSVAPKKQYLKSLSLCLQNQQTSVSTYGSNASHILCDYLLYYPFIDFTAVGEEQLMDNTVASPRYTDGEGVRMMLISQSAIAGGAGLTATVTYINQDGVQKTTPAFSLAAVGYTGLSCVSGLSAGSSPGFFIPLAIGDSGVRSVVSVTTTADAGGIAALVLVKPLYRDSTTDSSSRVSASGVVNGTFSYTETILMQQPVQIMDGAFLGVMSFFASDARQTQLIAGIETVWN